MKKTGPGESILMAAIRMTKTGDNKISPSSENVKSAILLITKYMMTPSLWCSRSCFAIDRSAHNFCHETYSLMRANNSSYIDMTTRHDFCVVINN